MPWCGWLAVVLVSLLAMVVLFQFIFWKYIAPKAGRAMGKAVGNMMEGVAEGIGKAKPSLFDQVNRAERVGRVMPINENLMTEAHQRYYDYRQSGGTIDPKGDAQVGGSSTPTNG